MRKLNLDKLSKKQAHNIMLKVAFSSFVKSLEVSDHWKCCEMTYKDLKDIHKHVSFKHMGAVELLMHNILIESKDSNKVKVLQHKHEFPNFSQSASEFFCTCSSCNFVVILFYHYVTIVCNLDVLKNWQESVCQQYNLKGKIRIASEGINGTLEGCPCAIKAYKQTLFQTKSFERISEKDFKQSPGNGDCFDNLCVSVCNELCTLGISPTNLSYADGGIHLSPDEFHNVLVKRKEQKQNGDDKTVPVLLDCRNFYESQIGYFDDAVKPDLRKFSYFPDYVKQNLDLFEGRDVLTYCTGGIRCERATAYIKKQTGCSNIYQLEGGIHKYLEKYPNGFFKGRLFVFDKRFSIDIGSSGKQKTSSCFYCENLYDDYQLCSWKACRQLVLICPPCRKTGKTNCCVACETNSLNDIKSEQCLCTAKHFRKKT